jgi:hypothetical protein
MPRYRVTFDVGADQILWWKIDAENEARARAESRRRFINDEVWSRKYPNDIPHCTVELVQESDAHRSL